MRSQKYLVMKDLTVRVDIMIKCVDKIGKLLYLKRKQVFMG